MTDGAEVAVARLLAALRDRDRWLLVFDNAEDPAGLAPFLPGGPGHVVITSRNPGWQEVATPLPVEVFTRAESVDVLRGRVPALAAELAEEIAEELGDLPLAVAQAAAFLDETGMDPAEYLRLSTSARVTCWPWAAGRLPGIGGGVLGGGVRSAGCRRPRRARPAVHRGVDGPRADPAEFVCRSPRPSA